MNTVLSVQGASAPVEKKSFFSKFTCLNMLRLVRAVIPVAVLMMLFPELAMAAGKGDLMAKGQETVKATFGKNSSIVKWIVLAEVLVGACSPNVWRKASLSGLRCVTVRYPLPARSWQCSSISWTGVSQKHPVLTH